jgi:hypothetical protein
VAGRSLVTLLSQAFVAFTIEADNEFEARMPHRTAADRGDTTKTGPWLVSLTFFQNYLRQLPDEGLTTRALAHASGDTASSMASRLHELRRWGYVRVLPGEGGSVAPGERIVRLTPAGSLARDTWMPIEARVEDRWRSRFGVDATDSLRRGIEALPVPAGLPLGYPILAWDRVAELGRAAATGIPGLSTLLARAILSIAIDFDREAPLSLATTLDLARVLDGTAPVRVPVRDLPLRTGISREAIAIGVGRLVRGGLATEAGAPKAVKLTPRGNSAARAALERRAEVDARWSASTGLAEVLDAIIGPKLAEGLEPPADGWRGRPPYLAQTRATLADPRAALPHFPMVSHRGGYPDGS